MELTTDFEIVQLKSGEALAVPPRMIQLRPTKMYIHPEGSIHNEPSFTIFMSAGDDPVVLGQISQDMFIRSMPAPALYSLEKAICRELDRRKGEVMQGRSP